LFLFEKQTNPNQSNEVNGTVILPPLVFLEGVSAICIYVNYYIHIYILLISLLAWARRVSAIRMYIYGYFPPKIYGWELLDHVSGHEN
jgi:hypothetical protein